MTTQAKAGRHGVSFTHPFPRPGELDNIWRAECDCGRRWIAAASYETVEDEWRKHVREETGTAPAPTGDKSGRWMPASDSEEGGCVDEWVLACPHDPVCEDEQECDRRCCGLCLDGQPCIEHKTQARENARREAAER